MGNGSLYVLAVVAFLLIAFIFGLGIGNSGRVCFDDGCFKVEIADEVDEWASGLMWKKTLGEERGMLFVFNETKKHNFWMKNTFINLDIIWINDDVVVQIHENAEPCDDVCQTIFAEEDANYVLEVNAGVVDRIGLVVGDEVVIKEKLL